MTADVRLRVGARSLLAVALLATFGFGQIGGHAVVVSFDGTSSRKTVLTAVDLASGRWMSLARFPSDGREPLAVALDPVQDDVLLAVRGSVSGSDIVRLRYRGGALVFERAVAFVPADVTSIDVILDSDLFASATGPMAGIWRVSRSGAVRRVFALPEASNVVANGSANAWITRDAVASAPPALAPVDLVQETIGPFTDLTGMLGRHVTGFGHEALAPAHNVLTDERGIVYGQSGAFGPSPVLAVPAAGTTAMHVASYGGSTRALVLGGAGAPYLWTFDVSSGGAPSFLAGPLPAAPVDFGHDLSTSQGAILAFGHGCAGSTGQVLGIGASFVPSSRVGWLNLQLQVWNATPRTPSVLLFGQDDQYTGGRPLPFSLRNGCELWIDPQVPVGLGASAGGQIALDVSFPITPSTAGSTVMAQCVEPGPPLASSMALSVRLPR